MKHLTRFMAFVLVCLMALGCMGATAESTELKTLRIMAPSGTITAGDQQMTLEEWMNSDSQLVKAFNDALAGYGLKLELDLIPDDQYQVVCQTRLATGLDCDLFDMQPLETATRQQLVDRGLIQPLNGIWAEHSNGTAQAFFTEDDGLKEVQLNSLVDGNLYWLTHVTRGEYDGTEAGATMCFMIRKDWADKLGKELPTTTDELFDLLVAFQENDMNGNGEKDEVISVKLDSFQTGIAQWFGFGPEITYIDPKADSVQTPWKAEHIKDYIDFMHRLVEAGLVDTSDQASQKAAENKIAGIFSWYTDTWTEASVTVAAGDDHACYVPVYCAAVDGVEPSLLRQAGLQLGSMALAVTSNCTDLDAVGALMDFVTSEEYYILTEYGVKDYTYTEDVDGVRTKIKTGDTFEQQLMASRSAPWTIILPRREMVDRKAEANSVLNAAGDDAAYLEDLQVKAQIAEGSLIAPDYFPHETAPNLAVETVEEMEQSNAIATDLKTYSSELLMKLILGDRSMDDWDSYLSDLERLGLDDYVAIHEARYERTK